MTAPRQPTCVAQPSAAEPPATATMPSTGARLATRNSQLGTPLTGLLNIAKPSGLTSHDVVARVRRITGQRSIGHAGTLDPLATGVLVLLLGKATVLASYVTSGEKVYEAGVTFGTATTTDDLEGEICREAPIPGPDIEEIELAVHRFVGEIEQVPPRFSAIKQQGKRAYAEARQGREIELPARRVTIRDIQIRSWQPPQLTLVITCGPGTYIRSLARDIGSALDSAAHLHALVRLASGRFRLEDATKLDDLTEETVPAVLLPADMAVESLRSICLSVGETVDARHGREVSRQLVPVDAGEVIRLYGSEGRFLGLARPSGSGWHPFRVLDPAP